MTFSIKESLRSGWQQFKAHSGIVLTVFLIVFAVNIFASMFDSALEGNGFVQFISSVLFGIVGVVVGTGATYIVLKIAKGERAVRRDIVPPLSLLWRYFVVNMLVTVITLGICAACALVGFSVVTGLLALELPLLATLAGIVIATTGIAFLIYVALRYSVASFAILEGAKIMESVHRSAVLTRGVKGKLVLFVLVAGLINLLGLLALVVGLLLTIPLTALAFANVYLALKKRVEVTA